MREKENNLRNHLTRLEQAGLFRWVHKEVDKDWEIGSITRLVFSGVSGRTGTVLDSPASVVMPA